MKRALLLLVFLLGCATAPHKPAEPVHVVLVGTTDVHGWFNGHDDEPSLGAPTVHYGGLPLLKSYVDALRAENNGHVLLLDSGDLFQGTLESNMFEGEPVIKAYNELGYSAAAIGNHEFDFGPVGPDSMVRVPGQDPLGALKRNAGMAAFPMLSANMTEKATGQTPSWARSSMIVPVGGVKIGIIGLSTPDTPNVTTEANVLSLNFGNPLMATISEARSLRAQGAGAIVVIAHMGGRCTDLDDVFDVASCETQQEAMRFVQSLPAGTIDAYLGGHSHSQMRHFVNRVPVVQALPYLQEFSTIDLWVDPLTRHVVSEKTNIRPLTAICGEVYSGTERCDPRDAPKDRPLVRRVFLGRTMTPDARVAQLMDPYLQRVAAKRSEALGVTTTGVFKRDYTHEAPIGDLLTDVFRDVTGADVAFINSGGIRAALPAGDLTYSDLFEVSPFDNFPAIVMLTGAQITDLLRLTTTGERGFLQVSGLKYTLDTARDEDKPAAQRNRLVSVTLPNGDPLDPSKLYRVALPDFVALGGDGTSSVLKTIPAERLTIDQSRPLREVLIEGLRRRRGPLSPSLDGRITVLNEKPNARHD